jgi:hypothetical protein
MTRQEEDFDARLDFDRFGVTSFLEAVESNSAFNASSNLSGFREIGFSLAMSHSTENY